MLLRRACGVAATFETGEGSRATGEFSWGTGSTRAFPTPHMSKTEIRKTARDCARRATKDAAVSATPHASLLPNGGMAFRRMLAAIDAAQHSIRLEMYIYTVKGIGETFRTALVRAAQRGVAVRVLVDGLGGRDATPEWWSELRAAGGEARQFNPLTLRRMAIRDHRKLLAIDGRVAFVGGFNIAPEYDGDGVTQGWFDLGAELGGDLAPALERVFDLMWEHHEFRHPRMLRWRRQRLRELPARAARQVLATGPGLGPNPFRRCLLEELERARDVTIISAYFTPSYRLRRALAAVVRRGGRVVLLMAGKSDVALAQAAAHSYYSRLLRAGVRIHEYEPQILHAKLAVVDDTVFVGSSNLDARSLGINYELMVQLPDATLARAGRALIATALGHSREITRAAWLAQRTWWRRARDRWAAFLLTKVDLWFARRQLRRLV